MTTFQNQGVSIVNDSEGVNKYTVVLCPSEKKIHEGNAQADATEVWARDAVQNLTHTKDYITNRDSITIQETRVKALRKQPKERFNISLLIFRGGDRGPEWPFLKYYRRPRPSSSGGGTRGGGVSFSSNARLAASHSGDHRAADPLVARSNERYTWPRSRGRRGARAHHQITILLGPLVTAFRDGPPPPTTRPGGAAAALDRR
ncbi:hypothetical protein EVAR_50055_1 [Eumeta japonica]|uniref:Uncharacterized protein n=1 Tax=Eumeta variegata TaxID=151549 RepID=A0A4C1XLD5_EUMVA|nr:hypothetical protein EVAR_50055_1 [Eumeta japonica]